MNIKKFLKIKGVGKFTAYSTANEEVSLAEKNVIFGYNTYGKSTFVSILKSLKDGDIDIVSGRKTFGAQSQEVEILYEDNSKKSLVKDWSDEHIEIFDNDFVAKNVYIADEVGKEQKSALHHVLIGEESIKFQENITQVNKEIKDFDDNVRVLKNSYKHEELGSFEQFIKIKGEGASEVLIKEMEGDILSELNFEKLKVLSKNNPLKSDFTNLQEVLSNTLDLSVEDAVNEHIRKNWKDENGDKTFLSEGLDLLKSGDCVFCGQDLTPVSNFIEKLQEIFSAEYREFKQKVDSVGQRFLDFDLEKKFLELENAGLELKTFIDYESLSEAKDEIDKKIQVKMKDLSKSIKVETDVNVQTFLAELKKLKPHFNKLDEQQEVNYAEIERLRLRLKDLRLKNYKNSKEGCTLSKEYSEAVQNSALKKVERTKLNNAYNKNAENLFKKYQLKINEYLKALGSNFVLDDFKPKSNLGQNNSHYCDFIFKFDGTHVVNASNKKRQDEEEPSDKPSFKNTLSESDKRALAFSFFLAKIADEDCLSDKVIVFDDPFSSFDKNRKEDFVSLIEGIENDKKEKPGQLIVMTHEEGFLCQMYKGLTGKVKFLQIEYSKLGGAVLSPCNVEKDFIEDKYFKNIQDIKDAVNSQKNVESALMKARPVLEHLLKRKYYFLLSAETIAKKSVNTYLDEIGIECTVKSDIEKYDWHKEMHDEHQIMQMSLPEKIRRLEELLSLIPKI